MNDRIKLTRRKTLAAMGGIGAASTGVGLGTSAYFSDTESFEANELTAGSLDLKVDWQEHYSDWSEDEGTLGQNVWMDEGDAPADAVPVPGPTEPMLYVAPDHLATFMEATSIEAYPDVDDDGVQDPFAGSPGETIDGVGYVCADGADTPEDLDPTTDGALRTLNDDTVVETDEGTEPAPLVNLTDVKPGDFGELTLSFHLCDNPGYLWLTGQMTENAENGVTEPEAKDPDEDDGSGVADPDAGTATSGELAEAIQTMIWYDSGPDGVWNDGDDPEEGDNIRQYSDETTHERLIVSGSLADVLGVLGRGPGLPLDAGLDALLAGESGSDADAPVETTATLDGPAESSDLFGCTTVGGNPHCADLGLESARKIDPPDDGTYETTFDGGEVILENNDDGTATITTNFPVSAVIMKGGPNARVCLAEGDDVQLDGATFETPINPNNDQNYGLSHVQICATGQDGVVPPVGTPDRECFQNSTTYQIGFAWWLPVDHANEIQTDSVAFDLGFYTEQCRHNDGAGMTPE